MPCWRGCKPDSNCHRLEIFHVVQKIVVEVHPNMGKKRSDGRQRATHQQQDAAGGGRLVGGSLGGVVLGAVLATSISLLLNGGVLVPSTLLTGAVSNSIGRGGGSGDNPGHGAGGIPGSSAPPFDVPDLLRRHAELARRDPLAAVAQLKLVLATNPARELRPGTMGRHAVLNALGDALGTVKQFDLAYEQHLRAFQILEFASRSPQAPPSLATELLVAEAQLASDLYQSFRFDEALAITGKLLRQSSVPGVAQRVLYKLESTVYECRGDIVSALQRFEAAMKIEPANDFSDLTRHVDLLRRVQQDESVPEQIAEMMGKQEKKMLEMLFTQGTWESEAQLPKKYIRNLSPGINFRDVETANDAAKRAATLLMQNKDALLQEYRILKAGGLMAREQECIHDFDKGAWTRFEITGFWHRLDPKSGCTVDTPVACKLLEQLRGPAVELPVIRAGFSAVSPGAWLRPHYGMSNGQLKFHLGLDVPTGEDGQQCAFFTVNNETRGWAEGGVTFFDDSFLHEVRNDCHQERVVFQVVFVHPDILLDSLKQKI